ncbi:MAG TPA: dipeptide epimerase [Candidatus Thermoplasmatota archaeon]|jgi:L-alanine-DL-glutamate epimerase-like enolase superfamily enzyme|nr:dipeptide epimerase [Candidatus Thermoplasmatota archaeon]
MELRAWPDKLPTKNPFKISTGTMTAAEVVFVELRHAGVAGHGEAAPSLRVTGETPAGVLAFLDAVRGEVAAWDPEEWRADLDGLAGRATGNSAAKAALEMALLDLVGQRERKAVHALLGLKPATRPTSATVVLDAPEAMAREATSHAEQGFTHLKLKLGEPKRDLARVRAVRDAVPGATLRCDANTAWTKQQGLRLVRGLDKLEVELLEQPVPRGRWHDMAAIAKAAELPVLADEDVLGLEDARWLAAQKYADGFVLKMAKCGGPLQGKQMLDLARRSGLAVMVGCMVESSLGISAAAQLLARVRWADLDGAWLLAQDPWRGAQLRRGEIATPRAFGLGAAPAR